MSLFDYVIVGGGTAGCVLANRLSASGRFRVLMLEAGGEPDSLWISMPAGFSKLLTGSKFNWRFQTEPESNTLGRVISVPRGKGLGGSTLINGMLYVRGQPADYDEWESSGAAGWGFNSVEPYFRRLEHREPSGDIQENGPMRIQCVTQRYPIAEKFLEAAVEDGQTINPDYNSATQEGFGYYQVTQHRGRRWSIVDGYLKPARPRKNLSIETHAHVQRLVLRNGRCVGVTYRQRGREHTVEANAEVILSAGTIQSPQLLELSGIGRPSVLQPLGIEVLHPLEGVGENYVDHFATRMNWRVKNTSTLNESSHGWRLLLALVEYFAHGTGILTLPVGLVHGFIRTRAELARPDAQYFFVHASYANAAERILDTLPGMTIGISQLRPESRGSIHVASADPFAPPLIRPNFLESAVDQLCIVRGMKIARRIVEQPTLRQYIEREMSPGEQTQSDAEWLEFARSNGQTIYHPIGTCRIGDSPSSVVDPRLRVIGIDALRVVDASVMPGMISGNIQAAVIMIAERASDLILEDSRL